jgi:hypothetical protein
MSELELPSCNRCGRPMRPNGATIAEYPDTLARSNATTCSSCSLRSRRNLEREYRKRGHPDRIDDHIIPNLTPGFRAYLARRRRRGVPAEGHQTAA